MIVKQETIKRNKDFRFEYVYGRLNGKPIRELNFIDCFTGETIGGIQYDRLPHMPGKDTRYRQYAAFIESMESGGLAYLMTAQEKQNARNLLME